MTALQSMKGLRSKARASLEEDPVEKVVRNMRMSQRLAAHNTRGSALTTAMSALMLPVVPSAPSAPSSPAVAVRAKKLSPLRQRLVNAIESVIENIRERTRSPLSPAMALHTHHVVLSPVRTPARGSAFFVNALPDLDDSGITSSLDAVSDAIRATEDTVGRAKLPMTPLITELPPLREVSPPGDLPRFIGASSNP